MEPHADTQQDANFWNEEDPKYGLIHLADRNARDFRADPLLVFVHGILGSCDGTWGETPNLLLRRSEVALDVFSFKYPAGIQGGNVEKAAIDLAAALKGRFSHHKHVVFFAHSTGGLVVKAMLRNEREPLLQALKSEKEFRQLSFEVLRTRRIVNLDVPHQGASLSHSLKLLVPYMLLGRPLSWLVRPFYPMRYNYIPRQLLYRNRWVCQLESDYVEFLKELDARALPRPVSLDVLAADDQTIAKYGEHNVERANNNKKVVIREDRETLQIRGSHQSHKEPSKESELICSVLGERRLRRWALSNGFALAEMTHARVFDFAKSVGFKQLVKSSSERNPESGGFDGEHWLGNQIFIWRELLKTINASTDQPRVLVVTGEAGVGKSIITRVIARDLSLRYLAQDDPNRFLPLLVPLQRVALTPEQADRFHAECTSCGAWDILAADWCEFVNGFYRIEAERYASGGGQRLVASPDWLTDSDRGQLTRPTVVILDGVDEFLSKNPTIRYSDFLAMIRWLETKFVLNGKLRIVLGVRNSLPEAASFARDPACVFQVRRLTISEAESLYPGVGTKLEKIEEKDVRELLLTPLILQQLGQRLTELTDNALSTKFGIFEEALKVIVRKNELHLQKLDSKQLGEGPWLDALMIVAWRYFVGLCAEMSLDNILKEAGTARQYWLSLVGANGHDGSARAPTVGFDLATQENFLRQLLQQTVFFPTGESSYRFLHKEWEEALAARYMAQCIRSRLPDELGTRASNQNMLRLAGEQLNNLVIDVGFAQAFMERARETQRGYIAGNFTTVLANSKIPMEAGAVNLILSRHREVEGISRYVLLSGFGYRALRFDDPIFREQVLSAFTPMAIGGAAPALRAIRSLCWCYAKRLSSAQLTTPWPGLGTGNDPEDLEALKLVYSPDPEGRIHLADRSIQLAFARIQPIIFRDSHRPISLVHYLYFLCMATLHHGQIEEVSRALPSLLRTECDYEKAVIAYGLPELEQVYRICQTMLPQLSGVTALQTHRDVSLGESSNAADRNYPY